MFFNTLPLSHTQIYTHIHTQTLKNTPTYIHTQTHTHAHTHIPYSLAGLYKTTTDVYIFPPRHFVSHNQMIVFQHYTAIFLLFTRFLVVFCEIRFHGIFTCAGGTVAILCSRVDCEMPLQVDQAGRSLMDL